MDRLKKQKLHCPDLNEVSAVLVHGLQSMFSYYEATVVDCPNLTEKPYMLASEGLCGSPALADVGGVPYLVPLAKKSKVYSLREIAQKMDVPNALIIGAGAGPRHHVGINCEMMANVKFGENEFVNTHIAKLENEDKYQLFQMKDNTEFCLLGNLFVSEGKPGKVVRVSAKHRKSDGNFVTCMRTALAEHYKDNPVGMGGVFVIKRGKAKLHIMPDYSTSPLNTDEDVNNWLKFFNMSAPLSCLSTFISVDPGLDLRIEHTHCFSDHGQGGHYHEDTEPDVVEYEGYFNVAEYIYRFDAPTMTHNVGRD